MLAAEIQRLLDTTHQKPRRIIQTFEEALHSPVGYTSKCAKPNDESRLTKLKYDCPAAPNLF